MKKLSLCQKIDFAILGIYFLVITPWELDTGCEMIFHHYKFLIFLFLDQIKERVYIH